MTTVRELSDPATLAAYGNLWESLLRQTPGASFFRTWQWLATTWRHAGPGDRMRVLVVYEGEQAIGILPLVVRTVQRRVGSVRVLTYPLDNWGSFYGPIGPDPQATLIAGLNHVRRAKRDWHWIELDGVDTSGYDGEATAQAFAANGMHVIRDDWQTSALVDLAHFGSWDNYWASRASHWRTNVRRSEKKLAALGPVRYIRYRPFGAGSGQSDPHWDWYEACEAIARASWQANSTTGTTLVHDAIRDIMHDVHQAAAEAGALDMNLLLVDGRPVAFNYAYHYRGYVFGLRTGFDRSAAADGAGSVLQARMIEDSFRRGDTMYDLGPGYLECKRHWMSEARQSHRYTHFPAGLNAGQLTRAKRSLANWWHGPREAVVEK